LWVSPQVPLSVIKNMFHGFSLYKTAGTSKKPSVMS
jgi:hypothetical protein